MKNVHLMNASVKVMRSHDYCHFEVALSSDLTGLNADEQNVAVDDMRKQAARLADKAVAQYQVAKEAAVRLDMVKSQFALTRALSTPENERTPQQKAIVKYHSDAAFRSQFDYDYQDDYDMWDNEDSPA